MFTIIRTLSKVIVARFYEQNSGLLLFVFFIMFGMVEGSQLVYYHLSLIHGVLESPYFFGMVIIAWTLYAYKCIQFTSAALSLPQNSFLFCVSSRSMTLQFFAWWICQVMLFIPVISYAICIVAVAIQSGKLIPVFLIIVYLLLIIGLAAVLSLRKLNSPSRGHSLIIGLKLPALKKSLWQFYFAYIFSDLKMIFVVTKVFSYLVVFGFLMTDVGHYEIRTAYMGLLIGLVSHLVLIFEFRKWEDSYLPFYKNLPIALWKRYMTLCFIYFLILLPEFMLLVMNKIDMVDLVALVLFGTSFLIFLHTLFYRLQMNMDRSIQWLFLVFLIYFALILFQLSGLVTLICLVGSARWFNRYFYLFE